MSAPIGDDAALALAEADAPTVRELAAEASRRRDAAWGRRLSYSPKVFLPVTNLCRNRCDYCSFRRSSGDAGEWTMSRDEVREVLAAGAAAGATEALLCLGDQPESAFPEYRRTLASLGHASTLDYLVEVSELALEAGLLPHTNAGIVDREGMRRLRAVNVSLGLMLENVSQRLCEPGMPHHRAPDKRPARRLAMLEAAGELGIAFTTGILIGIGETRRERVEALLAIRDAHRRHGHVQEVIVQNFTPHPGQKLGLAPPDDEEMRHAVALARLVLDDEVSLQAPPNLNPERTALLVGAGVNDFGGISPVTPDYINSQHPWPLVQRLSAECAALGYQLAPRAPIYPRWAASERFLDPALRAATERVVAMHRAATAA
jgi:FO synthase